MPTSPSCSEDELVKAWFIYIPVAANVTYTTYKGGSGQANTKGRGSTLGTHCLLVFTFFCFYLRCMGFPRFRIRKASTEGSMHSHGTRHGKVQRLRLRLASQHRWQGCLLQQRLGHEGLMQSHFLRDCREMTS